MLRVSKQPPLDYSLCNQTVTLYHADLTNGYQCTRTVFRGAFFDAKKVQTVDKTGSRETNSFVVILPSGWGGRPVWADAASMQPLRAEQGVFSVQAGDKILLGEGPELVDRAAWAGFVPAKTSGLVVVKDVDVKYWNGTVCHVEAGG